MPKLWKTTLVIWSEFDPQQVEITDLAREAIDGEAHCSSSQHEYIEEPEKDPHWDGTEFFNTSDAMTEEDDEEDEPIQLAYPPAR